MEQTVPVVEVAVENTGTGLGTDHQTVMTPVADGTQKTTIIAKIRGGFCLQFPKSP